MASLSDIVKGINQTNDLLEDNVKGQNRTAAMLTAFVTGQRGNAGDRLEAERASKKGATPSKQPAGMRAGFKSGFKKGSGIEALLSFGSKIIGALFSGVAAGGMLAAISVAAGTAFGALFLGGAIITLIQAFGEGVIAKIFDKLDPKNVILTPDQKKKIGKSVTDAFSAGVVGFIIGGVLGVGKLKLGAAFFLGSMLKDALLSYLTTEKQEDMKKTIFKKGTFESKFLEGLSGWITAEGMLTLGATIASFFGLGAIRAGIMMAFTGGAGVFGAVAGKNATVGRNSKGQFTKLRPGLKAAFFKGFGMRLGVGLMLLSVGQSLGNQIAALTGDEDLATFAQGAINATIIAGMLGGPYAALIVAIGALAVMGFKAVQNWAERKNAEIMSKVEKEAILALKIYNASKSDANRERLRKAENDLNQELTRKRSVGGGVLDRKNLLKNVKAKRVSGKGLPGGGDKDDFFNELENKTYTGQVSDALMNPYNLGSAAYYTFKKRAFAAFGAGKKTNTEIRAEKLALKNLIAGSETIGVPMHVNLSKLRRAKEDFQREQDMATRTAIALAVLNAKNDVKAAEARESGVGVHINNFVGMPMKVISADDIKWGQMSKGERGRQTP